VFEAQAKHASRTLGLPGARMALFPHPLGGKTESQVAELANLVHANLVAALTRTVAAPVQAASVQAARLTAPSDPAQLQHWCFEQGWSDGFPVIAPTPEAVARMVAGSGMPGDRLIGVVPPRLGLATVEQLAVNAVMAGCQPAYMPVIVAAVQAMLEPQFNLGSLQATTHPVAPLLIVHGPIARRLGISSGAGLFGPGAMANAVIGRAIRLILLNIGGATPGAVDRSTHGAPSKFSFCIAENIDASPWGSFVQDRGLASDQDAVTVFGCEPPHNVNDHEHGDAEGILRVAADVLRTLGMNTWYLGWKGRKELMLILGPEHAASIAASGWSRADVRNFLYQAINRRRDELALGGMYGMRDWGSDLEALSAPDALIPAVPRPDDILVLVAGGEGKHSAGLPSFGATVSVTRPIG